MEEASKSHINRGLVWLAGGIVFSMITSQARLTALGDIMYLLASGIVLYGFLRFVYGLVLYASSRFRGMRPSAWQIALDHYPDLEGLDAHLRQLSEHQAKTFRDTLLETKSFANRHKLASKLEEEFFTAAFGQNPDILEFGRELIAAGKTEGVKELKELVRVLGDGDASTILNRLRVKYRDPPPPKLEPEAISKLARRVVEFRYVADANKLIQALGGQTEWIWSYEKLGKVLVVRFRDQRKQFDSEFEMAQWVAEEIASGIVGKT